MPEIRYNFSQTGAERVAAQFDSIARKAERAARATKAAQRTSTRTARRPQSETEKLALRVARDQERAAKRVAQAEERAAQKAANAWNRSVQKRHNARMRDEQQHLRSLRKRERAERRAAERIENARRRRITGATKAGIGMGLRAVGAIGAAGLAVGGAAVRQNLQLQDLATKIAVQSRGPGQEGVSATRLSSGFQEAAAGAPGASAMGVGEAVAAFVTKTGDLQTALSLQRDIATAMVATGTEGEALGNTLADMSEKFDIKSVNDMRDAIATLVFQGKKGSFELEDAASQFAKLGAAAERFGGMRGAGGLKVLGGLTQIARSSTGSGERASTAIEAMFRQVVAKSSVIEKRAGVQVFKDKGKTQARDIRDILVETVGGLQGNQQDLQKVFGEEGIRAVSPLIAEFNRVKNESGSVAAGMAAMRAMLAENIEAGGSWAEVQKDAAMAGRKSTATLTGAWEAFKHSMGQELTPALTSAMKAFADLEKETGIISKAGETLGQVFTAIAEAGELTSDVLQALGLIKPKDPKAQAELEAKRKVRETDLAIERLGFDSGDMAMIKDIRGRYSDSYEQVVAAEAAGLDTNKFIDYQNLIAERSKAQGVYMKSAPGLPETVQSARQKFIEDRVKGGGNRWISERVADVAEWDPHMARALTGGLTIPGMGTSGAAPEGEQARVAKYTEELTALGESGGKAAGALDAAFDALKGFAARVKGLNVETGGGTGSGGSVFSGG